jgi:hypothetical protein
LHLISAPAFENNNNFEELLAYNGSENCCTWEDGSVTLRAALINFNFHADFRPTAAATAMSQAWALSPVCTIVLIDRDIRSIALGPAPPSPQVCHITCIPMILHPQPHWRKNVSRFNWRMCLHFILVKHYS